MKTNLITPNGIRVWQGYRRPEFIDNTEGFLNKLGQIFIPITVQLMTPMGLRMYYPAVVSSPNVSHTVKLPDEIALVGYPSQETYQEASHQTVAGRAYSSLHETVFNFTPGDVPSSFSSFPMAYSNHTQSQWKTPYYFSGEAIDWHDLYVGVIVWTWPEDGKCDPYRSSTTILNACDKAISSNHHLFEVIAVMQENYGIIWFASDVLSWPDTIIQALTDNQCSVVMQAFHDTTNISPLFSEDDSGIQVSAGQALDVRLSS
ncbi:hypothetical protein LRP50_15450 [Enterovibrio sp. ZSDZ42]|uniref:Uncharacterized protein n=1 Tax=Enterovibrio gelatinilyticus TaxID=2899819 RepID=A0ABT5R2Q6_9GAMM|nr:hypothetical protein [Enterovibrio sp. ZSDZ42]MDD1794529.1 hypothetical protein [Enterovibrio sp. ZSDZ42]